MDNFESERLTFKPLSLDVLDWYHHCVVRNFDEFTKFLFWPTSLPERRDCEKRLHKTCQPEAKYPFVELSIHLKETNRTIIGTFSVCSIDLEKDSRLLADPSVPNTKELGFWIDKLYKGQGFATEAVNRVSTYAFESLGADAVVIIANSDNKPQMRVAEKNGYKFMKTYRYVERQDWGEQEFSVYAKFRNLR